MVEGPLYVSRTASTKPLSPVCHLRTTPPRVVVRVIGPVELVVDDHVVGLRSSRTRRLVAMLALYRDRLVSADRLIDAIWREHLPSDPGAALQSQLSRLRSSMGTASSAIETMSGGYRLRTDLVSVDIAEFEALLASARDERRGAAERAALFDRAVVLVRGPAFEDLEVDDAYIEARRIEELAAAARVTATALSVEATAVAKFPARRAPAPVVDVMGRDEDLRAIRSLLASGRVITLTGPGGVGKTTLALAAVQRHCAEFESANAFVDLAPVATSSEVLDVFARALGVERPGDQPWPERLSEAIRGHDLLVVVDTAEHVVDAAAPIVAELVARTEVVVLTTSRVPLHVPGEQLWVVEPLDPEGAAQDLFRQRAEAVRPPWATAHEDEASVQRICRAVDGLPLGIELAAAQLRWRTAAEVAASLDWPLRALAPLCSAPSRQPDLRSVIHRSYRLLDERERWFLDHLGVFTGGFTAAAAASVCDDDGAVDEGAARRTIGSLVQHSLVHVAPAATGSRYTLLHPIRHFALEQLEARGRAGPARDRHAAAMLRLLEQASREVWGPEEPSWVRRVDDERADICAAHHHLLASGETEAAVRLATTAYWVAWPRGWSDLRGLIGATAVEDLDAAPDVIAPALGARADLFLHGGELEMAVDFAERAVAAAGDRKELSCFGEAVLADVALFGGRTDEAVWRWRTAGEGLGTGAPVPQPWATAAMALALAYGGRAEDAVRLAADAISSADVLGCATTRAFARYAAGEAATGHDPSRAPRFLAEAIAIATSASGALVANLARLSLATSLARSGHPTKALSYYPVLLQEWRRSGHWAQQWIALRTLVPILVSAGAVNAAGTILGGLRRHGQADAWGADADELRAADAAMEATLSDAYDGALACGSALSPVDLVLFAERASGQAAAGRASDS
jgi:predicted ATPase/DNA-binding winged helix-turn-helix (wHTH) protein